MRGKYDKALYRMYENSKPLPPRLTKEQAYDERVWHAIHGATMEKIGDDQAAVAAADEVVRLIRVGRTNEAAKIEQQRAYELDQRRRRRRRFFGKLSAWVAAGTMSVLLGWGLVTLIVNMEANDYAGMDQKYVNNLARAELVDWYGNERLGEHKVIISKQRGHYFAQSAWKVKFRLPESQGIIKDTACVYLWDGNNGDNGYFKEVAVREGLSC